MKLKMFLCVVVCIVIGFSSAIYVNAQQARGYCTYETVTKDGLFPVYSNSTGTNMFSVKYGATSTNSDLGAQVQYCYDLDYINLTGTYKVVNEGSTLSWDATCPPYRLYRLRLDKTLGRGTGWIQGQE